jgi:leucyl aminopeptidase
MKVTASAGSPAAAAADLLAVGVTRPVRLEGAAALLDERLGGALGRLVRDGEIRGTPNSLCVVHAEPGAGVRARRVAVVGLGGADGVDADRLRTAAATAAKAMQAARGARFAMVADGLPVAAPDAARAIVEGAAIGAYRFDRYRTRRSDLPPELSAITVLTGDREAGRAARRAGTVTEAVNRARDLQHTPPNDMGPEELAARAREIARGHARLRARVLDERGITRLKMGAFLAVAQASGRPPRLIELRHTPARPKRGTPLLGIVAKGVTYDTGGYSIKPVTSLPTMKYDMSAAAAALEATAVIAELGLPLRVITVVGAVENMIDREAMKPDDVVTAANGKTIEITNTDAEGRLVLADCLHHARTLGATHVIDLATLTAGVTVALGDIQAGVMGRDQVWLDRILAAGERSGDHLWPLPLHESYKRLFRSDVADMANSGIRQALASVGGMFLAEFAGEGPWAHVDMAGIADILRPRDYYAKGGTGYGVRLLVELAESLC